MKGSINKIALYTVLSVFVYLGNFSAKADSTHHMHRVIKHSFKAKYPDAKHVVWTYLENGYTEADFILNEKETSVFYDKLGNLEETDVEIKLSDIPDKAKNFIDHNYVGCTIKHVMRVQSKDIEFYKIVIVKQYVEHKLKFDKEGIIIGGYSLD